MSRMCVVSIVSCPLHSNWPAQLVFWFWVFCSLMLENNVSDSFHYFNYFYIIYSNVSILCYPGDFHLEKYPEHGLKKMLPSVKGSKRVWWVKKKMHIRLLNKMDWLTYWFFVYSGIWVQPCAAMQKTEFYSHTQFQVLNSNIPAKWRDCDEHVWPSMLQILNIDSAYPG